MLTIYIQLPSLASSIETLPYLLYVLVLTTVPDADRLKTPKLRQALCDIVVFIAMAGFAIGQNHRLFLTCQDFKVAGDDVPIDCRKAPTR